MSANLADLLQSKFINSWNLFWLITLPIPGHHPASYVTSLVVQGAYPQVEQLRDTWVET